jgi:hypothetical protein
MYNSETTNKPPTHYKALSHEAQSLEQYRTSLSKACAPDAEDWAQHSIPALLNSSLSSGQLTTPGEYVVRRYEYRLADAAASKTVNLEVLMYNNIYTYM